MHLSTTTACASLISSLMVKSVCIVSFSLWASELGVREDSYFSGNPVSLNVRYTFLYMRSRFALEVPACKWN